MLKIMKLGIYLVAAFLYLFSSAEMLPAAQTDSTKDDKVYRLDEIVVHGHPVRDEGLIVTPDVTVINVEKFIRPGRMENITDLLGEVLGITVLHSSVTPAQNEGVFIRGMDQSRFQVFMDGRPIRLHGSHGYFKMDWTTMPLTIVETIEIVRGSHSLLFPYSQGGVVNIITKKGIKTTELRPQGNARLGLGPYGDRNLSASVEGGFLDTVGYALGAGQRKGDGFLRGNDYRTENIHARFSLFLPRGGMLTYGFDYVDTETGYAVINDPDDPASDYDPKYPVVRAGEVDTFSHDFEGRAYPGGRNRWEREVTDHSLLLDQPLPVGTIRAQAYEQRSERYRYRTTPDGIQERNFKDEYTGGVALSYRGFNLIPNHSISIGGDYRNQGTFDNKDYYRITSFFIRDVWSLTDSTVLTFGTRWYEFKSDSYKMLQPGQTRADMEPTTYTERVWAPKARLDYEYDNTLSLYASISREKRMP